MSFSQSKVAWISVLIGAGYTIFPFYYDKGEIFSYRKSQCDEDKNSLAAALVNKQFNAVAKSNNESYSYTNDRREYVISYNQNHSSGFMIVYDSRTRAPRYTVELLRKEDLMAESKNKKKRPNFRPEAAIDFPQFQVELKYTYLLIAFCGN